MRNTHPTLETSANQNELVIRLFLLNKILTALYDCSKDSEDLSRILIAINR